MGASSDAEDLDDADEDDDADDEPENDEPPEEDDDEDEEEDEDADETEVEDATDVAEATDGDRFTAAIATSPPGESEREGERPAATGATFVDTICDLASFVSLDAGDGPGSCLMVLKMLPFPVTGTATLRLFGGVAFIATDLGSGAADVPEPGLTPKNCVNFINVAQKWDNCHYSRTATAMYLVANPPSVPN